MYILFEGIDFSGKSTQIEMLAKALGNAGITKEPGGTPLGNTLKGIILNSDISPLTSFYLFLADRAEHFESIDFHKGDKERHIISDRGFLSHIGYAKANNIDFSNREMFEMNRKAMKNIMPDHIIFLKINKETFFSRQNVREHDVIEKKGIDFLFKAQQAMIDSMFYFDIPYSIIDGTKDVKQVHNQVIRTIEKRSL